MIIRPPNSRGAGIYERAPMTILKSLHGDGSESTPDTSAYLKQVLPPNAMRARIFERFIAEPTKYLLPDGSVWEGPAPFEGGGGTDLTKGGVINGNLEINGNLILHGNETIDGNLLIGDVEVATRQFLLSVTPPRDAADRSGITMHVVNNGAATYSFFAGMDTLTETITIPPVDIIMIADTDDFPEFEWYQGDSLIEVGTVLTIETTGITEQSVKVVIGSDGMAIMNFDMENPLVLNEGSIFMFNKVLLLGSPETTEGATIQAAQAAARKSGYNTCAGFLEDIRVRVAKLRGGV